MWFIPLCQEKWGIMTHTIIASNHLLQLNETKEYTLLATSVIESILTDISLKAQTSKLWIFLYNKAKCNPSLEITVSNKFLAENLGKSTRTITEYVKTLSKQGYLVVKENYNRYKGQICNTFCLTIPSDVLNKCVNQKDRKKFLEPDPVSIIPKDGNQNNGTNRENLLGGGDQNCDHNTKSSSYTKKQQTTLNRNDIITDKENVVVNYEENEKDVSIKIKRLEEQLLLIKQETRDAYATKDPQLIQKCLKMEDEMNDFIKSKKSTLNRPAIDAKEIQVNLSEIEQIEKLNKVIIKCESEKGHIQDKIKLAKSNKNFENSAQLLKEYGEIAAEIQSYKIKIELLTKTIQQKKIKENELKELEARRPITNKLYSYLKNQIKSLVITKEEEEKLTKEVIYASRYGSLVKNNQTNHENPIQRSINVALKLIKEGRWSTPLELLAK